MTSEPRSILLVHPDPVQQGIIAAALAPHRVVVASGREAAVSELRALKPDLIIAAPENGRRLLKDFDRAARSVTTAFLCHSEDTETVAELRELACEGFEFFTLDARDGEAMNRRLMELIAPRIASRTRVEAGLDCAFSAGGAAFQGACLDISNDGVAVVIGLEQPVERLLPGTVVSAVEVRRGGELLMGGPRAEVRHVRCLGGQGFAIGLRLGASTEEPPISDATQIRATLRRAARREMPLALRDGARDSAFTFHSVWQVGDDRLQVACSGAWSCGDVAELTFDLAGKRHFAHAAVLEVSATGIALALPRTLRRQHRRGRLRVACPPGHAFGISYRSPFTGMERRHEVIDLQPMGVSFRFDAADEALPPGLELPCVLHLPDGTAAPCRAKVVGAHREGGNAAARCGLELVALPPAARQAISDAFFAARSPALHDGRDVPFQKIWELMARAKNRYIDYPETDPAAFEVLERAHRLLTSRDDGLGKAFVSSEGERVVAAGYGLRIYSGTWLGQHVMVEPGVHRAEQLSRELATFGVDYPELLPDVEFIRCLWKTTNRWSERVMGWSSRMLRAEGLSSLRFVNYMRLEADSSLTTGPTALQVRRATDRDLVALERHMRERGDLVRVRAEDLTADRLKLEALGERFSSAGMHRSREVFVVDGAQGPVLFGLAEHLTHGLCWPEFHNGFSLVTLRPDAPELAEAWACMLQHCAAMYRAAGQKVVIAMCEDDQVSAFQQAGFTAAWRLAEWTFHRSTIRTAFDLLTRPYERIAGYRSAQS